MARLPQQPQYKCENPVCGKIIGKGQYDSTKRTLGKGLCSGCASKESAESADLAMTPMDRVLAYLARNNYVKQKMSDLFILDTGTTEFAVKFVEGKPVAGVIVGGLFQSEEHGISRVKDMQRDLDKLMTSGNASADKGNARSEPNDMTEQQQQPEAHAPTPAPLPAAVAVPAPVPASAPAPVTPVPDNSTPEKQPEPQQLSKKIKVRSNKELSFGALVDKGLPKEEIMKLKAMTEKEYDRIFGSLQRIRDSASNRKAGASA